MRRMERDEHTWEGEPSLTVQELEASYLAHYDLGPGYPQIEVPSFIRELYLDDAIENLSLRFAPFWSPEKQAQVDADLESAVRLFVGIPSATEGPIRATFSGSVALERAMTAVIGIARDRDALPMTVVTTSPSIDIMKLFLQERVGVDAVFVPNHRQGVLGNSDAEALVDELNMAKRRRPEGLVVALLTSPENPTGAVWSREELRVIGATCAELDAVLIMDHCFVTAGVHEAADVPRVWDLNDVGCHWIAIWDTGKTFGLNEDKLGFIICGSRLAQEAVDKALAVLQFGVARRQKMFFGELLRRAFFFDHAEELQKVCRENLAAAMCLSGALFVPVAPTAGSLLLLDISELTVADELARSRLLTAGVGVIAGRVFFHSAQWRPNCYLRVALARRPAYFAEALQRLNTLLAEWAA